MPIWVRFTRWSILPTTCKLRPMGYELNHKTQIFPLRQGLTFLQWRFALTETGKVLMLMSNAKIGKQRRRIRKLWARERAGTVKPGATEESVRAFLANANRGDTWRIQQAMKRYYTEYTGRRYNG